MRKRAHGRHSMRGGIAPRRVGRHLVRRRCAARNLGSFEPARELGGSVGWSMAGRWNSKHFPLYSHTMLVMGPEHARTFAVGGWSKDDLKRPYRALLPDADHGEGTNLRPNRRPFFGGDSRLAGHEEWFASGHACAVINSIDFLSGACHSSRRFWQRRSQVTIVRDRDTRRAGPVPAAFLFAPQSRRATPPRWREHRGLKTP